MEKQAEYREEYDYVPFVKPKPNWWERRLMDVNQGYKHAKHLADKNKVTRWLFDTRDIALKKGGNDWEDVLDVSQFSSKLPDSILENLAEFIPQPHTAVLTNFDDFKNSGSPAGLGLETLAAVSPWTRKLNLGSKTTKSLQGAGFADYIVDTYEDNAAGVNPDIQREDGADPWTPWGLYETEQIKANTSPVPKPKPLEYKW